MNSDNRIDRYNLDEGLNQSFLKKVVNIGFNEDDDEFIKPGSKRRLELGSIVDCILTYPEGLDSFMIIEEDIKRPSPAMEKLITNVYKNRSSDSINENEDVFIKAIELSGYVGNKHWNINQKIDKIRKETEQYWIYLIKSEGKTVVTQEEYSKAESLAADVLNFNTTRKYFEEYVLQEVHRQWDLYWECEGNRCKSLLDLAIEDVRDGTIQPIDIKVTSVNSRKEWKYVARSMRYDFQGAFYRDAVEANNYICLPFINIVVFTNKNINPFIYVHSDKDYYIGKHGARRMKNTIHTPAFQAIEEEYIYGYLDCIHIYNQSRELRLDHYDIDLFHNKGKTDLNLWE